MTTVNGNEVDRSAEVLGRLFDVRGVRAVVTGAASGLGFAMAEVLADAGARVTLADIDAALLEDSTGRLAARGGQVRSKVVDVSDADQVQALNRFVVELGESRFTVDADLRYSVRVLLLRCHIFQESGSKSGQVSLLDAQTGCRRMAAARD